MPSLAAPADGKRILRLGYGVKAMHFCTIFATF